MLVSAMATDEHDLSPPDDVDDNNGNVSAETTKPTGKLGSKASPWLIAKAHQKVRKPAGKLGAKASPWLIAKAHKNFGKPAGKLGAKVSPWLIAKEHQKVKKPVGKTRSKASPWLIAKAHQKVRKLAGKLGPKASPWVIAKAHQKVKSKNTSSSKGASKHGGGGKAPKKKATRARLDGEQETVEVDEDAADLAQPGDAESHADIGHHPHSVADELAEESKKAKDTLRMTAHSVCVLPSIV